MLLIGLGSYTFDQAHANDCDMHLYPNLFYECKPSILNQHTMKPLFFFGLLLLASCTQERNFEPPTTLGVEENNMLDSYMMGDMRLKSMGILSLMDMWFRLTRVEIFTRKFIFKMIRSTPPKRSK